MVKKTILVVGMVVLLVGSAVAFAAGAGLGSQSPAVDNHTTNDTDASADNASDGKAKEDGDERDGKTKEPGNGKAKVGEPGVVTVDGGQLHVIIEDATISGQGLPDRTFEGRTFTQNQVEFTVTKGQFNRVMGGNAEQPSVNGLQAEDVNRVEVSMDQVTVTLRNVTVEGSGEAQNSGSSPNQIITMLQRVDRGNIGSAEATLSDTTITAPGVEDRCFDDRTFRVSDQTINTKRATITLQEGTLTLQNVEVRDSDA